MEVFHSLLSDKWTGGQEIGFATVKECIVKRMNVAQIFKRFVNQCQPPTVTLEEAGNS